VLKIGSIEYLDLIELEVVKQIVRKLRKNQTIAEKTLWKEVRNRKLANKKFVRQYPILFELDEKKRFFVADFYCHEYRLIIEVDGKIHDNQKERDQYRTYLLNIMGYRVIRFKNEEVLTNIKYVLEKVLDVMHPSLPVFPLLGREG